MDNGDKGNLEKSRFLILRVQPVRLFEDEEARIDCQQIYRSVIQELVVALLQ